MKARGKREARRPWYTNRSRPSPERGVIYFGPSGLTARTGQDQGRRASRLPLAFIFRAFGAGWQPLALIFRAMVLDGRAVHIHNSVSTPPVCQKSTRSVSLNFPSRQYASKPAAALAVYTGSSSIPSLSAKSFSASREAAVEIA